MSDPYSTSVSRSYFQRLGESFKGILAGFVIIAVAIGLLWWNENRAVVAAKGLAAASDSAISLTGTAPDAANDGKLVHATGEGKATAPVGDPDLGIVFADTLTLSRKAEMYQWKENSSTKTEERMGGGETTTTTYSYEKVWSETAIDSGKFNPDASAAERRRQGTPLTNPPMKVTSKSFAAEDGTLGGFRLKPDILMQATGEAAAKPSAEPEGWTPSGQGYYQGMGTAERPRIGDTRVTYTRLASPQTLSVLARQQGANLERWRAPNGYEVYRLEVGDKTAEMMIQDQQSAETTMTWVLRAVGTVLTCNGFGLILAPIKAIANVIPFLANIVGFGTGAVGVVLGLTVSLVVIALAWLFYRPLIGGALLAAAVGLIVYFGIVRKSKAASGAAPA
jgi:hypothetical protein